MQQLFVTLGPILAVAIPAALIARYIVRDRREMRELEQQARCGPGCICGGENVRAYQHAVANQQAAYIQAPPQMIYVQAPAPVYLSAPQPQVVYLPSPRYMQDQAQIPVQAQPRYLPAARRVQPPQYQPREHYAPPPQPMTYYPGPEPDYPEYQQHYLPPARIVGQLPPASASDIEEARRMFEIEKEEMKQGRQVRR
jgi:hypothetical protein